MISLRKGRYAAAALLGSGMVLAALAPVSSATQSSPAKKPVALLPISLATSGVTGNSSPVYTGFIAGLYKKYGLQLTYNALTPTAAAAAVINGNIDIADDGPNIAAGIVASGGSSAKVFMTNGPTVGWVYCKAGTASPYTGKKVNQSFAGLKGLTIATTTPGGGTDTALHLGLKAAGLTVGQNVSIAYLSTNAGALSGVLSGKVQCAAESPPNSVQAQQDGLVQIASFSPWDAPSEWAVNESWAKSNKAAFIDFIKAFCAATRLSITSKSSEEQGLTTYAAITAPAQLDGTWNSYKHDWACAPYPVSQMQHFVLDNLPGTVSGQSIGSTTNAKSIIDSSIWNSIPKSLWTTTKLTS